MRSGTDSTKISIIIPAYNEEAGISDLLGYLSEVFSVADHEIIVVDGGSADKTRKKAENFDCRVLLSDQKGRAAQMNYGALHSTGEILYFLHADTFPPKKAAEKIQHALKEPGMVAGCFRLKFDDDHPALRMYSWFTQFDVDLFRFGDQSLFIKRTLFGEIGGFNDSLIVMEDQEIIGRIKQSGKFRILNSCVSTSARKYRSTGLFKLQLIFALILLMYYLGVSQEVLISFYRKALAG